ncbi:general substrate transporter [Boletus coccyginus]|nr:general substrate transporter [Boletus coccyginus]
MASRGSVHGGYSQLESNDAIVSRLAQHDKVPWYKKPNLRLLYLLMFPTCLGVEMTSGFDSSMLNGFQAVPSWVEYYHHPHSALLGLVSATYSLGAIAALSFVPSVVDKFGRRRSILIGSILMILGGALQGTALNLAMFIMARFFLGSGIVFAIVAASSLVGELSHPKERAIMGALFDCCYSLGSLTAAGVTLGTFAMHSNWGWRIPSLLQAVPSLLQVSFIRFLPESPRWLISKGRGDEAYAILVKYHAEGDENSEFVKAEYTQIAETLEEEMKNAEMGWKETFLTAGMRKRVIIASFLGLFTRWSGNGLISYFLSPILANIGIHNDRMKNTINFAMGGWALFTSTFLALTVPRFPRRRMYLTCTISLLVVFIAWTVASAEYARTHSVISSHVVLALIFVYTPAYSIGFSSLTYTFLVELFPFHARAKGITIFQWWARNAEFITQFVDPIGIEAAGWKYYIIYCVWIAFEVAFVYFMFPETSGRTLEELTFLYEDDHRHAEVPRDPEVVGLLEQGEMDTHDAMEDD